MLLGVTQTWITLAGLALEAVGLFSAAVGLRRSKLMYDGGYSESYWAVAGLTAAGVGLLAQIFDLTLRQALLPGLR